MGSKLGTPSPNQPTAAKFSNVTVLENIRILHKTIHPNLSISQFEFIEDGLVNAVEKITPMSILGGDLWRENKTAKVAPFSEWRGHFAFFGDINFTGHSRQKAGLLPT